MNVFKDLLKELVKRTILQYYMMLHAKEAEDAGVDLGKKVADKFFH